MSNQDILYEGLPCIFNNNSFLVFSPHSKKIIKIPKEYINNSNLKKRLEKLGVFKKNLSLSETIAKTTLLLTSDCNLKCKYCYMEAGKNRFYMKSEFAIRAIKELIKPETKRLVISFFGGEPMLNMKALKRVVDFVKALPLDCYEFHITTNTTLLTDEVIDYFIKNKFSISVSMDGPPKVNDSLRQFPDGSPTSKFILKTIKRLVNKEAHFLVRATITNSNVQNMREMVDYFASLGVKFIHFEVVNKIGRAKEFNIQRPNPKEFILNFKKALDKAEEKNVYLLNEAFHNLFNPSSTFCTSCSGKTVFFTPDEYLSACYEFQYGNHPLKDFIIGHYDTKKDKFIKNKSKAQKLSKLSVNNYKKCRDCFAKYICGGGCPTKNLRATGSLNKPDPYICNINKQLIKEAILRLYKNSKQNKVSPVFGINLYEKILPPITIFKL